MQEQNGMVAVAEDEALTIRISALIYSIDAGVDHVITGLRECMEKAGDEDGSDPSLEQVGRLLGQTIETLVSRPADSPGQEALTARGELVVAALHRLGYQLTTAADEAPYRHEDHEQ
jgi:hypothetical protein